MTDTSSNTRCGNTCAPKGIATRSCDCSSAKTPLGVKSAKYGAGVLALCGLCCAVPPALIALGFVSIATAALLGTGMKVAIAALVVLGLGSLLAPYLSQYLSKKR